MRSIAEAVPRYTHLCICVCVSATRLPAAVLTRPVQHGLGLYTDAILDFSMAINLRPSYPYAITNRARAYVELGLHSQAIGDFGRAIAINPLYAYAYYYRGILYCSLGRKSDGLFDLSRAVRFAPHLWAAVRAAYPDDVAQIEAQASV